MAETSFKENSRRKPTSKAGWVSQQLNEIGKLPPQAVEFEEAVLGAMMIEKEAVNSVIDILSPESFYKPAHEKIYGAIKRLF